MPVKQICVIVNNLTILKTDFEPVIIYYWAENAVY